MNANVRFSPKSHVRSSTAPDGERNEKKKERHLKCVRALRGVLGFNLINLICCRKCGSKNIDYSYNEYTTHQKVVGLAGPVSIASYLHLALRNGRMVDDVEDVFRIYSCRRHRCRRLRKGFIHKHMPHQTQSETKTMYVCGMGCFQGVQSTGRSWGRALCGIRTAASTIVYVYIYIVE